ncbi:hypothetical protein ONZ43_g7745 [Nemania bipapillata]|uniref:Uncharacterized protein n=1 Tax=Nemania bipapillata TaxID=110536 RepID=A0ACC2HNZ5_9PEZI|nr:hypothetical protein ONZ43_g7745 [Nemania bipapillata]
MANVGNLDLPIALRRAPRRCASASSLQLTQVHLASSLAQTPGKPRTKKRVRFSDPGPELAHHGNAALSLSTGLTPTLNRSSLSEPSSKRRRRSSTPAKLASGRDILEDAPVPQKNNSKLRARKANSAAKARLDAELQHLQAELANRDAEIARLRNETIAQDTERILELEKQVESLNTALSQQQQQQLPPMRFEEEDGEATDIDNDDIPSHTFYDWTLVEEPKARSPKVFVRIIPYTTMYKPNHTGHAVLNAQDEPANNADPHGGTSPPELLEEHLNIVVKQLEERTVELLELDLSLSTLGFQGTESSEMIMSITSSLRAARLEIEYLSPGEVTLPLTSRGADVLDLLLTSIRTLSRKLADKESAIDEYHALELSLRQQLTARVDAMASVRADAAAAKATLAQRDARIAELEGGVERLKGAAAGYRSDIAELEALRTY